ncbi:DUF5671 domain-containing protein [Candidatus Chlorohelix sp.]|uniref:DUF5671 domain-containing protein n=1 Tax=Candidatus Chlorohelix sp. TaxID=3139201 RepID=UPI00302E479F
MLIARRLYIYATSFISLMMLVSGLSNLLNLLFGSWLEVERYYYYDNSDSYIREQYSLWGAIAVVGGVVWLIHWILAQRNARAQDYHGIEERQSTLRKLMLYLTLFVTALQVFIAAGVFLGELFSQLANNGNLKYSFANNMPILLVSTPVWLYFWLVTRADNRIAPEHGGGATVRGLYFFLMNYGAASVLAISVTLLGQDYWKYITGSNTDPYYRNVNFMGLIASVLGWVIVSLAGWLWHWWQMQRLNATSEKEQHSLLRKFYLYTMLLQTIIVTVTAVALFMYNLMRLALGSEVMKNSSESLLTQVGNPVVVALVYGMFWGYHALVLHRDMALLAKEPPLQANLRRLYWYLLSLIGLITLSFGLARLIRIMLDLALGGWDSSQLKNIGWSDEISQLITLILVGGAVWLYSWLKLQRQSLAQEHVEERRAAVRRIYLYLTLFMSVVTLLISGAWLIYQFFRAFDNSITSNFISGTCWALGITLTAALWLVYHLQTLLGDLKAKAAVQATIGEVQAGAALVFIYGRDAALIAGKIAQLQRQLPADYTVESLPTANLNLTWLRASLAGQVAAPENQ